MIWPPLLVRLALTASGTARFLSIALLILSVAPWYVSEPFLLLLSVQRHCILTNLLTFFPSCINRASIYALFVSIHARDTTHSFMNIPPSDVEPTSLAHVLRDHNATLEDLWIALFRDRTSPLAYYYYNTETTHHYSVSNSIHHWTIVLPWGISLVLGIVIPLFLSLCSCMQGQRDNAEFHIDPDEDPWISRHRKERRLSRLIVACEEYRKVSYCMGFDSCDSLFDGTLY